MLTGSEMIQTAGIVAFAIACFHTPNLIQWLGGLF